VPQTEWKEDAGPHDRMDAQKPGLQRLSRVKALRGAKRPMAGGWRSFPALVMDYFGGRNVSGIIGILYTKRGVRHPDRPQRCGILPSISANSYTLPIFASVCANLIAAAIMAATAKAPATLTASSA